MHFSDEERRLVEEAVAAAELRTSGEIVAVVAEASGSYSFVPYLWASIIALSVPWPLIQFTWMPVQNIYLIQLGVFAGTAAVLHLGGLRFLLVPRPIKRQNAHRRAVEQFLAQNLHTKANHTGVLLFVSAAERYVEVLPDAALAEKVPQSEWRAIIHDLTQSFDRGDAAAGLTKAVTRIGDRLAAAFPAQPGTASELPNHLILLRGS